MVTSLRQRAALASFVLVIAIPVLATNLRGLTHLLTCSEAVAQPFAISDLGEEDPVLTSSQALERGGDDQPSDGDAGGAVEVGGPDGRLCEAVRVRVLASSDGPDQVLLTVEIANDSDLPWRGTVGIGAEGDSVSIASGISAEFGRVEPGSVAREVLELRVPPGQTELEGTLLLGP